MSHMDRTAHEHETEGEAAQQVGAKGPDELRRQIERTRSELGNTVEELAGKVDVKGRARARAADLRDKAGAMTVQLRSTAAQAGHTVQEKAHTVEHNLPVPVRNAVDAGRRHPRPLLVAGAVAMGMVIGVQLMRRGRHC
jgi:HSP90 family molecular chaperone